jgi:hypothetical protein
MTSGGCAVSIGGVAVLGLLLLDTESVKVVWADVLTSVKGSLVCVCETVL